ncbi:MAG: LiaF domain-containing protein [Cyclobacteriaceae bacterium]
METNNKRDDYSNISGSGKVLSGIIVVIVGSVLLAKKVGADIPNWIISWEMLLITIGIYIGVKHGFRTWGWMIPVFIGSIFLVDRIVPDLEFRPYLWPVAIITVGLFMIFNPRSCNPRRRWKHGDLNMHSGTSDEGNSYKRPGDAEDYLDSVSIFGGIEKNVVTKDFKGGDVTTFFGGSSINLSQADIKDRAVLNLTQVFGGAQLVIPSNWKLHSEVVSVFGGVEDKRAFQKDAPEANKTLVLRGTSVFGGIEIKSY